MLDRIFCRQFLHVVHIVGLYLIVGPWWNPSFSSAQPPELLLSAKQILFLGDSITDAGHYINELEAQARLLHASGKWQSDDVPEFINLGLPSETCSGLSEPDHPFPRPDVHERLQRALEKVNPDVVVACYGMNDGIYYPFSEKRFAAYQAGVDRLIERVHRSGAKLILMTPPAFDPLPFRKQGKLLPLGEEKYAWFAIYEDYDDVMARYSAWLLKQADRVEMVIDLREPVLNHLQRERKADPNYTISPDGVHLDKAGHRVLSAAIMKAWGLGQPKKAPAGMHELIEQYQRLLHLAWLSRIGHKRPGVEPGLPLNDAQRAAEQIETRIQRLLQ